MHPAAVIGEHAVGIEHLTVLAVAGIAAAFQQHVEIGAHAVDRALESLELLRDVLGDEVGDHHTRLVQHHMAERDAVGDGGARKLQRPADGGLGARLGERRELARGDHLGEHHGRGLQRLLFLFGISAPGAVLHHQHAEGVARAQDRHAEEGVVDFFAGLRPIGEGRMGLGVGQVDRLGVARDLADQAFVGAQHGLVDGFALQAFSGV
jgi:hypothetical protein